MYLLHQPSKKYISKYNKLSAILVLTAVFSGAAILSQPSYADYNNTRTDAWGDLELAGSNSGNMGGEGVDIYSNGSSAFYTPNKPNNSVSINNTNVISGEKWQCVELVNRLYLTKGWTTATWTGNGNQLYAYAPTHLTKEPNGSITYLAVGDQISMNVVNLSEGHTGIISSINGSSVTIINQNTGPVYLAAAFTNGSLTLSWTGYTTVGVVHAPAGGGTAPTPLDKPSLMKFNTEYSLFKRGTDNKIYKTTWGGSSWSGFGQVTGGTYDGNPVALKQANSMVIFARGQDSKIWKNVANSVGAWGGWTAETGSGFAGDASAIDWASGTEMHMFVRGTDNKYYIKSYWSGGNSLGLLPGGGTFASNPLVIQYGSEMDIFGIGTDGKVWKNTFNGSSWSGPTAESGTGYVGNPAALQYNSEMDVVVRNADNKYYKKMYNASGNTPFTLLDNTTFKSDPAVLQFSTEFSVFGTGTNSQLYKNTWGGSSWSGFGAVSGGYIASGNPAVLEYGSEMVVVVEKDGTTEHKNGFTYGGGWSGFGPLY